MRSVVRVAWGSLAVFLCSLVCCAMCHTQVHGTPTRLSPVMRLCTNLLARYLSSVLVPVSPLPALPTAAVRLQRCVCGSGTAPVAGCGGGLLGLAAERKRLWVCCTMTHAFSPATNHRDNTHSRDGLDGAGHPSVVVAPQKSHFWELYPQRRQVCPSTGMTAKQLLAHNRPPGSGAADSMGCLLCRLHCPFLPGTLPVKLQHIPTRRHHGCTTFCAADQLW